MEPLRRVTRYRLVVAFLVVLAVYTNLAAFLSRSQPQDGTTPPAAPRNGGFVQEVIDKDNLDGYKGRGANHRGEEPAHSHHRRLPVQGGRRVEGSPPTVAPDGLMNGVVLYLYGGRWQSYFTRHALPRLDRFFLRCWPYPVHIFHDDAPAAELDAMRTALRVPTGGGGEDGKPPAGQSRLEFEDVAWVWRHLPNGVSDADIARWRHIGRGKKFPGRGYRIMCRFWAGLVWRLPSLLDKYEYYWRLDTDSILTRPLTLDPFRWVFRTKGCVYGYNRLKGEAPAVTTQLWETYERWANTEDGRAALSDEARQRVRDLALINKSSHAVLPYFSQQYAPFQLSSTESHYWGPMFYNNFEMGTFELKQRRPYASFFKYVDSTPPYGIFRHRWGDAPLHTLGVVASAPWSQLCNVTSEIVGYRHAFMTPGPLPEAVCTRRDSQL